MTLSVEMFMTAPRYTKLRIFAASPSDVASERAKLSTVVENLKPLADNLGLVLEVVDWRAVVPEAGRPQQVIFDQLKPTSWDVFVGILWHRFGTPPGASNTQTGKEFLSGTDEEFATAYNLSKQFKRPRIMLYRCTRALPYDVDPDQLKRVREFFKLVEDVKGDYPTLYQAFDTTEAFEKLLLDNLQKLLLEYGEAHGRGAVTAPLLAPKIPDNLPRRAPFFGRTKEIAEVMRALSPDDRGWGVIVDGIGGIGKTALAVECAHRAKAQGLFDAFAFVSAKTNRLEPSGIREQSPAARTRDEFINETARVLGQVGIAQLTGDGKRRAVLDALRGTRALLIWDNLETLDNESQLALADLLRDLPQGCKAIVTSRRGGGEGALWLRIEGLDWDAAREIIIYECKHNHHLKAVLLREGETRWRELFKETAGSPLALIWMLGQIRARALGFDRALEMLVEGGFQSDLQKFIYGKIRQELSRTEVLTLGAISFFRTSATLVALLEMLRIQRHEIENALARLVAFAFVNVDAESGRHSIHPLALTFIRDDLRNDPSTERVLGMSYAKYWHRYVDSTVSHFAESHETFSWLREELFNVDGAIEWLYEKSVLRGRSEGVSNGDTADLIFSIIDRIRGFLLDDGWWDECIQVNKRGFDVAYALGDDKGILKYASWIAEVLLKQSLTDEAVIWVSRCEGACAYSDDPHNQATIKRLHGLLEYQRGNLQEAENYFHYAHAIWRDLGIEHLLAVSYNDLGVIAMKKGDYRLAHNHFSRALELTSEYFVEERAEYAGNLGWVALKSNLWSDAQRWFNQELSVGNQNELTQRIADAQLGLAHTWDALGRPHLALPLARKTLAIYEQLRHKDVAEVRALVERLKEKAKEPPP